MTVTRNFQCICICFYLIYTFWALDIRFYAVHMPTRSATAVLLLSLVLSLLQSQRSTTFLCHLDPKCKCCIRIVEIQGLQSQLCERLFILYLASLSQGFNPLQSTGKCRGVLLFDSPWLWSQALLVLVSVKYQNHYWFVLWGFCH